MWLGRDIGNNSFYSPLQKDWTSVPSIKCVFVWKRGGGELKCTFYCDIWCQAAYFVFCLPSVLLTYMLFALWSTLCVVFEPLVRVPLNALNISHSEALKLWSSWWTRASLLDPFLVSVRRYREESNPGYSGWCNFYHCSSILCWNIDFIGTDWSSIASSNGIPRWCMTFLTTLCFLFLKVTQCCFKSVLEPLSTV